MLRPPPARALTAPARPRRNHTPTSIRRPLRSTTASALPAAAVDACIRPDNSTASKGLAEVDSRRSRPLRYRPRVLNASPRSRQNSLRLKPLASNSATKRSISARLRRRRTTHTCSSFMLLLHHQIHRRNRWVGLTLTSQSREVLLIGCENTY